LDATQRQEGCVYSPNRRADQQIRDVPTFKQGVQRAHLKGAASSTSAEYERQLFFHLYLHIIYRPIR
jgi:hypothetical protein